MRLSTRARYGIRAMADIASQDVAGPISLGEIAERQGLSRAYLEQIMARLRDAGLIRVQRGQKGGVRFARPAGELRLDEIFVALEGQLAVAECLTAPEMCERWETCATRRLWGAMTDALSATLSAYTVADLVDNGAGPCAGVRDA